MALNGWNIVLAKDSLSAKFLARRCLSNKSVDDNPVLPCKSWDTDTAQGFVRIVLNFSEKVDPLYREAEVHIPCTDIALICLAPEESLAFGFTPIGEN